MDIKDVEVGKYYFFTLYDRQYIAKVSAIYDEYFEESIAISPNGKYYFNNHTQSWYEAISCLKKASPSQILHLEACSTAGKYIDAPKGSHVNYIANEKTYFEKEDDESLENLINKYI